MELLFIDCKLSALLPPDDWKVSDSHEKADKVVDSLPDLVFALKVLEGIKASPHASKLNDLDELYKHLSTKDVSKRSTRQHRVSTKLRSRPKRTPIALHRHTYAIRCFSECTFLPMGSRQPLGKVPLLGLFAEVYTGIAGIGHG